MFMNKTLVANLEDKRIFLISDNNISFYIGIPNDTKVTIVLNYLIIQIVLILLITWRN